MNPDHLALNMALMILIDRHTVWSSDFELIRPHLCALLAKELETTTKQHHTIMQLAATFIPESTH